MKIILVNMTFEGAMLLHYELEKYHMQSPLPTQKINGEKLTQADVPEDGFLYMTTGREIDAAIVTEIREVYPDVKICGMVGANKQMPHAVKGKKPMPKGVVLHQFLKPEPAISFLVKNLDLKTLNLSPV